MALTQTQLEKIATLFTSGDFSYAKQGIELVDALIDNEQDFVTLLESMGSSTLTYFTFDELRSVFGFVSGKGHRSDLAIWALGTLAQWNTTIRNHTELELDWSYITTLPDSIGNLTNLSDMRLGGNQFTTLPDSIGNLTNLDYLDLAANQFTAVPDSIGNLTHITELVLADNQLTTLPESFGNLTNLTGLYLSNNQFWTLPDWIENLTNLTELILRNNQLSTLPYSFGNLTNLTELHLKSNQLTTLPESIENLNNNQTFLDLSDNPISESELERIQSLLPNCEIDF